jgi:signal peptidase I
MAEAPPSLRASWLRALSAGVLSLFWPGLGQVFAGWWGLGVGLFVAFIVLPIPFIAMTWLVPPTPIALAIFLAVGLLFVILRIAIAVDAVRRMRRWSRERPGPWYRSIWLAAIAMTAIWLGFAFNIIPGNTPAWHSYWIASASNTPTLNVRDYVMADLYGAAAPSMRGEIVVFRRSSDPNVDYIKRIVGLPGDRVQLRRGVLYLNGQPVPRAEAGSWKAMAGESASPAAAFKRYQETLPDGRTYYVLGSEDGPSESTPEYVVPADSFFVLGDNRDNSLDSRMQDIFGYVKKSSVTGTARTIYWSSDLSRLFTRVQ